MTHNAMEDQPKKRLMITEMVLSNFKSYAGDQRVGPFHKSFSSVVGPNGSGKSNVIDAMLFVFGKKAKQLRLNKVSELIHNSTNHRNLEMAKVSVYFQEIIDLDDENYQVIPNSHFVVSRTAHRNNKSDYYINDRKSTFTEVTDMLKGKGIDLDNNRFLILQGEVEQISLMKPKGQTEHETGLLEYLEDIIGTERYKQPLEDSGKQLEELNEKRQSMLHRVKIAEKERDALESEKTAAEAYLDKERESLGAQSILAQLFVKNAKQNVEKIENNVKELEEKLAYEKKKFADQNLVLQEYETKYNAVAEEHGTIQKDLEKANTEFKEFERKDIKYREDLKHAKARLKKLDDKIQKDGQKMGELEADIARFEADVPALEARAVELGQQLAQAEAKVEALMEGIRDEVEALRGQLQDVRAELVPWEKRITQVQGRIDVAAGERDLLVKAATDAQQRLDDAKVSLKAAKESAKLKRQQAADMEVQVKKLIAQVDKARGAETQAKAEVDRLEGLTREVRGRVEQRKADANSRMSAGAVVTALNEAKARKEIDGIFGRLGDLGAIDSKYDIAVSTSCPALDYIVVDTTSTAQRCVELLRKRSLGVATFLILEKQQHLTAAATAKVSPPEGVPRLFDLVSFKDERLRVAFYFAMRDTIVAADLEQASRIAYGADKRWRRVVTVKGEMINESGTMTGGGGKPRGGRMCLGKAPPKVVDSREAAADLQSAEQELEQAAAALGEARHAVKEAAAQVKAAEKFLAELETAIPKTKMEAEAAAEKAEDLENRMAELQAATKVSTADAQRLKQLEAEVVEAESELATLRADCKDLSKKAAVLEQAIDDAGGEKLKRQRALVTAIQKEQANCEAEATKKGVQASSSRKQLDKLKKELEKSKDEHEKLVSSSEKTKEEFKALEDAAFKVLEVVRATSEVLAAKEAELAEIRSEFETRQREVSIIRQVEADIGNRIDMEKTLRKENRSTLKQWEDKAAKLALQIAKCDNLDAPPAPLADEDLDKQDAQELQYRVTILDEEMQRMNIDLSALEVWKQKDAEYVGRVAELEAATAERDVVRKEHDELRKKRLDGFMAGFNTISLKLKEMYQMITMGGDAELELVDSLDPFSEGIIFSVRPPKKSWKNIANLSGGEKTLSSLSLVFALHHYKPTPLYVMDEIDAALDFKNVSIVGHYIKERTKNAQFVIISLRNNMFELADRLVGIYKTDNCTKSVAVNPGEFAVGACRPQKQQEDGENAGVNEQEQLAPAVHA